MLISHDALTAPAHRRATVLIVDDEASIRTVLARLLRDHDLTLVGGFGEALAAIATGQAYDIILSDLMLADGTGMGLYEHLQQNHPELVERMVFITGGAVTPDACAFLERVSNERFEKPFTSKDMTELVQRYAGTASNRVRR